MSNECQHAWKNKTEVTLLTSCWPLLVPGGKTTLCLCMCVCVSFLQWVKWSHTVPFRLRYAWTALHSTTEHSKAWPTILLLCGLEVQRKWIQTFSLHREGLTFSFHKPRLPEAHLWHWAYLEKISRTTSGWKTTFGMGSAMQCRIAKTCLWPGLLLALMEV